MNIKQSCYFDLWGFVADADRHWNPHKNVPSVGPFFFFVPTVQWVQVVNVSVYLATKGLFGFSPLSRFSRLRLLFFLAENGCKPDKKKRNALKSNTDCCANQPHFKSASSILENVHQHKRLNSEIMPYPEISPKHPFFLSESKLHVQIHKWWMQTTPGASWQS